MSDQEKIALIVNAIQDDAKLVILLRAIITKSILTVNTEQLDNALTVLGLV